MMLRAAKHILTEIDTRNLPESRAEVAFVGRSNVGKSTLINAVCQQKGLAHVSTLPGKTRTITVYEVTPSRWLVDLPGYGYAVGKADFGTMIEKYLTSRDTLCMVFVVLDAVAGPTKLDISMISWLVHCALPFRIIVNKIDKVKPSVFQERKTDIAGQLVVDTRDIFWISSKKRAQIEPLQKLIVTLLGA